MLHTRKPTRQPCSARASESNARCVPTKKKYCPMICPVQLRVLLLRLLDVVADGLRLVPARDEEVGRRHQRVVLVGVAPGDRRVPRLVHELVVVEVVRGHPGEGGVPVEDAQPVPEDAVELAVAEGGGVVVVVGDDPRGEREVTAQREQPDGELGAEIGDEGDDRHGDCPRKRPPISCVPKIHVVPVSHVGPAAAMQEFLTACPGGHRPEGGGWVSWAGKRPEADRRSMAAWRWLSSAMTARVSASRARR